MRALLLALAVSLTGCTKTVTKECPAPEPAAPVLERADLIHRGDTALTILGNPLDVGADLPSVTLSEPDAEGKLGTIDLASLKGKLIVLSVVPSIDTRVCEAQTHAVSNAIPNLPPDTVVFTVSRDLPFAQTRFKEEAMTQTRMASDYHGGAFGKAFGLEVKESGLLARSVWVIDRHGKIAYRELVDDQGDQPDYDALVAAATRIAGS